MDPALRELLSAVAKDDDGEVEAIIRLDDPAATVPGLRVVSRFGRIGTCRLAARSVRDVHEHGNVLSLKAPRALGPEPAAPAEPRPGHPRRPTGTVPTGAGVVVGVVDWGCDFDHPNIKRADGSTRLDALWDQHASAPGEAPEPYGYGRVYWRHEIDEALRGDDPYTALGYHPADADRDGSGAHGMHVTDIAAGNGSAGGPVGMAPKADLVFVHLADRGTGGLATLGDSVRLLEAVDFIARTAGERPWVVNISAGRQGGPHDGCTLVELALDELLRGGPNRCVVQSAGNYFDRAIHADGRLAAGEARPLTIVTDERDLTPNEIEVWYTGSDELRVMLESPTGARSRWVPLGDETDLVEDGQLVGRIYHRARDPNNGDNHVELFLHPWAPAGGWTLTLEAISAADGRFHGWIERDEACKACQAHFDVAEADGSYTIGTIANGRLPIVVGAYDARSSSPHATTFSSSGPTRDGRAKPDVAAPGKDVVAARSAPRGSIRSPGGLTTKSGTSMATPHIAGLVALCLEAARRPLAIDEIRALVLDNAVPSEEPRAGRGYVDVARTLAAVREAKAEEAIIVEQEPSYALQVRSALPERGDVVVRPAVGEGFETRGLVEWRFGDEVGVRNVAATAGHRVLARESGACWRIADNGVLDPAVLVVRADGDALPDDPAIDAEDIASALASSAFDCGASPAQAKPVPAVVPPRGRLAPPAFVRGDDPTLERGVAADARAKNEKWWTQLELAAVRPLRDLEPALQPRAYANRVVAAQRLLRAQQRKLAVRNVTDVDVDGVLGPRTFLALRALARQAAEFSALHATIGAYGFDLDGLLDQPAARAGGLAEAAVDPPEVIDRWTLSVDASKVFDFYKAYHREDVEAVQRMDRYLFGPDGAPADVPNVSWDDRIQILRELAGATKLSGQTAFVRVNRRYLHERDVPKIDPTLARRGYIEWRLNAKARKEGARILGLDFAKRPRSRAALATMEKQGGALPHVGQILVFDLPKVPADFQATAARIMLDAKVARDREQAAAAADYVAQSLVATSPGLTRDMLRLYRERLVEPQLIQFTWAHPVSFDYFLDALKARPGGGLGSLFSTWAQVENFDRRDRLAKLAQRTTKYAAEPALVRFLEAHRTKTIASRRHTFDVASQQVRLEQGRGVVSKGAVVDDVWGGYHRDDPVERIKPERLKALCNLWMKETATALDALVADESGADTGPATDKLVGDAFMRAAGALSPPLSDADVQKGEVRISLRVYEIRVKEPRGAADRYEIRSALVQRFEDEPWQDLEEPRWRGEDDFTEELDWFRFSEQMDATAFVVTAIAGATVVAVSIGLLWAGGVAGTLVRLAGGRLALGANVGIELVIKVITKAVRGELTDWSVDDFVDVVLDGYLNAVGFRLFAPLGARALRMTPSALRGRVVDWLVPKLVSGTVSGAATAPASLFSHDLIRIMRDGGSLRSWRDYLGAASNGAKFGVLGEVGGSALLEGLFYAGRAAIKGIRAPVPETPQQAVELLQKNGIAPATWTAEATVALSRFEKTMAGAIKDDAAVNAAAAMRHEVEQVTALLKTTGGVSPNTHIKLLGLAKADLSRDSVQGIERLLTNKARVPEAQIDEFVTALAAKPANADRLLSLLGAVDEATLAKIHTREGLAKLASSDAIATAIRTGSAGDVAFVLSHEFKGSLDGLDGWARELGGLDAALQREVLDVVRAHGAFLRPSAALAMAKAGVKFTPELRAGLERLTTVAGADPVNALLARTPPRIAELATAAARAADADLPALAALVKDADRAARLLGEGRTIDELIQAERHALPGAKPPTPEVTRLEAEIVAADKALAEVRRKLGEAEAQLQKEGPALVQRERAARVAAERAEEAAARKPGDQALQTKAAEARKAQEEAEAALDALRDEPGALRRDVAEAEQRLGDARTQLEMELTPPARRPTAPAAATLSQRVTAFQNRFPKVDRSAGSTAALTELFRRAGTTGPTYLPTHTRAAAAELETIAQLSSRPEVTRIELIPSSPSGRTPDIVVDVRGADGSISRTRVEVTTVTGGGAGYQPHGAGGQAATTPGGIAAAVREKIASTPRSPSQLAAPLPGVPEGGTVVVDLPFASQKGTVNVVAQAADAMALLKSDLARAPYVHGIEFHIPGWEPLRYVRAADGTFSLAAAPVSTRPPPRTPAPSAGEAEQAADDALLALA